MMTGRKFLFPPSYGSLRNPITGVPRARKLKIFSNMARRKPFSRALQKARREVGARTDDRAQISKPPPSYGSLRNPITGAPRARKLMLFSNMARCNPFSSLTQLVAPQKARARGANFWSAARALKLKLEAVFQYGPPQSDYGGGRLTPRCSIGAGGCAESILDQGTLNPAKGKSWVVRGGGNA